MKLKLIIGDNNLSSWSMRPWLALKASGAKFQQQQIFLDLPTTAKKLADASPTSRVPVLIADGTVIWDSLAICEFAADLNADLLPKDIGQRALARSYMAEMHSGFFDLRNELTMYIQLKMKRGHLSPGTVKDITRVVELWSTALKANKGPYLFGKTFGLADSYYAPVVMRFISYGIDIEEPLSRKYIKTISDYKYVREWVAAAIKEKPAKQTFK